ncbi:MAG TPA: glutamine amidotransferase [Gemmataceae bacterium]|nr:glutamine amidotransferase [Gemmataceae bacterium]
MMLDSSMDFTFDPPSPWSHSPVEILQSVAMLLPGSLGRLLAAAMPILGRLLLAALCAALGWLSRSTSFGKACWAMILGVVGLALATAPLPAITAVFLVFVTLATYRGSAKVRGVKLLLIIGLRLLALLIAILTIVRPALAVRDDQRVPSVLLIGCDFSKSMTLRDEYNKQSRFETMQKVMERCEPIIKQLEEEQQITVKVFAFAEDVQPYDKNRQPDGNRTDIGGMLNHLHEQYKNEPNLRGMLIASDGADNGTRFNAVQEAAKYRAIQCPIHCFALGQAGTSSQQKDVAITSIVIEPSPVYVKGRMIIRAKIDAFGFENSPIDPVLEFDGKGVPIGKMFMADEEVEERWHPIVALRNGNELRIETTAPPTPGEIRVTLRIKPLPEEVTISNNEISTYVSVVKEGVSVLIVDDDREERKYIRNALSADPRFRVHLVTRQTEQPPPPNEAELYQLERQAYDVIILGDVSAKRLRACDPKILDKIRELVDKKGVGFMMMGGHDSFGGTAGRGGSGDWQGTPIADLLPVDLSQSGQVDAPTEMYPTPQGEEHYLLQLAATKPANVETWRRLNQEVKLGGYNRLGKAKSPQPGKPLATVLAGTDPGGKGEPLMVFQMFGKGRVLAFGPDTTWYWGKLGFPVTTEGWDLHDRFWKQVVLWLAQQENSEGNVWIKPDFRRLPSGSKQAFSVGVKGRTGVDLPGARFDAKVIAPDGASFPVQVSREGEQYRGYFWRTDTAGEYRIEVAGMALDTDQKPVNGRASVRFLVYQDESELLKQAAEPETLQKIAAAGGGRPQVYRMDDLPQFLKDLKSATLPNQRIKIKHYPDWKKKSDPWYAPPAFQPFWLMLFVTVLSLEWGLRRWWGMV